MSSEELAQWLKDSPALKQVVVLDTCAAGAAATSLTAMRNVPSDQIRALDRLKDRAGVYVLMGAAADRVSYEASQYEQGLLTHALLKGMTGAKLREDQYVDVAPLLDYAADEVAQLAQGIGGIQKPYLASPRATAGSFDIGKLGIEERKHIPLRSPKAFMLPPRMINLEVGYDDLELEPLLRAEMREATYAQGRGQAGMGVTFVEAEELAGAIRPTVHYRKAAGQIELDRLVLVRDRTPTEVRGSFSAANAKSFVEQLLERIGQAAARLGH